MSTEKNGIHRLAKVTAVNGNKMQLMFDGEEEAGGIEYTGIYVATVGERVLCAKVCGTYVVLGTIKS